MLTVWLTSAFLLTSVCTSFDLQRPFPEAIRSDPGLFAPLQQAARERLLVEHPSLAICYVDGSQCPETPETVANYEYQMLGHIYRECQQATHSL